jgi:dipeptidyl aminopeptidase/acylaminoacyl peptidase
MTSTNFSLEDFVDLYHPSDAQISPDGKYVAFVLGQKYKANKDSPFRKAIYLAETDTGKMYPLTMEGNFASEAPRWSPDGCRLAFLSNRLNKDEMQLYLMDIDGSETQPLTDLRGKVAAPMWSPDGRHISFLYDGTLDSEKSPDPDPIVEDANPMFNRVWLLDIETSELQPSTPETYHVHEYAWAKDGAKLALVASDHPNTMQGWYNAQLFSATVTSGEMQQLCTVKNQFGRITWSPDNLAIAYVSGILSDEGNISGEVCTVSASGGEAQCITPGIDWSITWIDWHDDGILCGGRQIDSTVFSWLNPETGKTQLIDSGNYSINGVGAQQVSVSADKTFAAVRASFTEVPNIYIGSLESCAWQQLTNLPVDTETFPPLRVENEHWENPDGTPVHGFLVYPNNYEPNKKYPLFLHVHGGPSWCYVPDFFLWWERLIAERDCFTLMPNPRGSWGRGHNYQSANVGDLGGGDWQDINAGVDHLIDKGIVDPDRIAIGGWSYGGYLVTWAVTQTNRFCCAIAGASITNYESNYGVVRNREWQTTMFGSNVYDNVELHRSRSPIVHVGQVKTPTLLVHGEKDKVAPPQQPMEFYTGLKHFDVQTQLVLYPREPHGFTERDHQIDLLQRIGKWVDKYMFGNNY